jgi:hypothetical protein
MTGNHLQLAYLSPVKSALVISEHIFSMKDPPNTFYKEPSLVSC